MLHWMFIPLLLLGTAANQACADHNTAFDNAFAESRAALLQSDATILVDNPGWAEVYADFRDVVVDYASTCAASDLHYEGAFTSDEDLRFGYDVIPSVTPIDINLDGTDEWLIHLQVGSVGYGGGQAFADVLYWNDDAPALESIWPLPGFTALTRADRFPSFSMHSQPDVDGRSYMGIAFLPGIGPYLYVHGVAVIRWDGFQPEVALFVGQRCAFLDWHHGADGGLYFSTSSAIPWEGCTAPNGDPEDGIRIPGARMGE